MNWNIGKSVYRKDSHEKVTGTAKLTADYTSPQTLHIKLVTSSYAHAKLIKIDISKAEQSPGVHAVILGQKEPLTGGEVKDRPILAYDKVRYYGEPIATVVADSLFRQSKLQN